MNLLHENHYWAGTRCARALWWLIHQAPETPFAVVDPEEHRRLLRLAAPLLPGPPAILQGDAETRLRSTQEGLKQGRAMLDAALSHDGWIATLDYLGPHPEGGWQIIAVLPQTSLSPTTRRRLGFQARIAAEAGVALTRISVWTLNPNYCRRQRLEPANLFVTQEIHAAAAAHSREMGEELDAIARAAFRADAPSVPIGPHCEAGGDCPFKARCWGEQLPEHNIFHVHRLSRKKAFEMQQQGCVSLERLPRQLRTFQRDAQLYAVQTGRPYVNRPALRRFLARLEYPLHCLDFETVNAAIPWLPGLMPLDQVPVQFSLTRVKARGAAPEHEAFVCTGSDPRTPMLDRLKSTLGRRGSILAYNASFEQSVLKSLTRWNPADTQWLESLRDRWVDVLEPFRNYDLYYAQQKGSCSLKEVLPAVTGKGYADLAIQNGYQATCAWLRLLFDPLSPEDSARLRQQLVAYCRRDTEALAWLVQELHRLAG